MKTSAWIHLQQPTLAASHQRFHKSSPANLESHHLSYLSLHYLNNTDHLHTESCITRAECFSLRAHNYFFIFGSTPYSYIPTNKRIALGIATATASPANTHTHTRKENFHQRESKRGRKGVRGRWNRMRDVSLAYVYTRIYASLLYDLSVGCCCRVTLIRAMLYTLQPFSISSRLCAPAVLPASFSFLLFAWRERELVFGFSELLLLLRLYVCICCFLIFWTDAARRVVLCFEFEIMTMGLNKNEYSRMEIRIAVCVYSYTCWLLNANFSTRY